MTLIVLGLALWWAAHLWKRVAPGSRGRWGAPGKGLVAVVAANATSNSVISFFIGCPLSQVKKRQGTIDHSCVIVKHCPMLTIHEILHAIDPPQLQNGIPDSSLK